MPDASHGHVRPRGTARLPGAPTRGSASASAAPSPRRRPRGHRPRSRRLGRRGVVGVGGRLSERSSGAGRLARATIQGRGRIGSRAVYDRARLKQKKLFLEPVSHSHGDTVIVILVRAARAGDCGAVYAASDHGLPTLRVCAALAAAGPQRGTRCLTIAKDATPHNLASEKQNARAGLGSAAPAGRRQTAGRRTTSGARRLDMPLVRAEQDCQQEAIARTDAEGWCEREAHRPARSISNSASRAGARARPACGSCTVVVEGVGMGRCSPIEHPRAVEGSERRSHQQGRARVPP